MRISCSSSAATLSASKPAPASSAPSSKASPAAPPSPASPQPSLQRAAAPQSPPSSDSSSPTSASASIHRTRLQSRVKRTTAAPSRPLAGLASRSTTPIFVNSPPSPHPAHTGLRRTRTGPALATSLQPLHYKFTRPTSIRELPRHHNRRPFRPHRERLSIRIPECPNQLSNARTVASATAPSASRSSQYRRRTTPAALPPRSSKASPPESPRSCSARAQALPPSHSGIYTIPLIHPTSSGLSGNVQSPALKQ